MVCWRIYGVFNKGNLCTNLNNSRFVWHDSRDSWKKFKIYCIHCIYVFWKTQLRHTHTTCTPKASWYPSFFGWSLVVVETMLHGCLCWDLCECRLVDQKDPLVGRWLSQSMEVGLKPQGSLRWCPGRLREIGCWWQFLQEFRESWIRWSY